MYTHNIRTIWKVIVINVLIVISWTFLVTPHSFLVLITIKQGIAVSCVDLDFRVGNLALSHTCRVREPLRVSAVLDSAILV